MSITTISTLKNTITIGKNMKKAAGTKRTRQEVDDEEKVATIGNGKKQNVRNRDPAGTKYLLDCVYYPNWIQSMLGKTPDEVMRQLSALQFADRQALYMRLRGNPLSRDKFCLVDCLDPIPVYLYTGYQHQSDYVEAAKKPASRRKRCKESCSSTQENPFSRWMKILQTITNI